MDIVYIVRPGDENEMLRYSLRSLVNLPHDRVWIVGHKPSWVSGVEHVPGNRAASEPQCVYDNVRIACAIPDLSDRFVMMNDDFFIARPAELLEGAWRCTLAEHIASISVWGSWKRSLQATQRWLQRRCGVDDPLSYELHIPLVTDRHVMADVLAEASGFSPLVPPQWRTLYGARVGAGGQVRDVKVRTQGQWDAESPWLSCYSSAFERGAFGEHIRALFPEPSPFELVEVPA